ncbi:MAG: hypothetical protein QOI39_4190 [Mycobacterium sp.]|jgi:hypothetical protein|nr:hypothetical protein [Mycobacterium sp.]
MTGILIIDRAYICSALPGNDLGAWAGWIHIVVGILWRQWLSGFPPARHGHR